MAEAASMTEGAAQAGTSEMAAKMAAEAVPDPGRPIYLEEARVRIAAALGTEIGFVERLVWFWSNHFCVSADKIRSMSGAYEREAIRPHVLGRFTDLLLAAEGHPAMLFYLDQTVSMGANSIAGINRTRGLNENLAREILELHTLGVRTGYTQDDVISFANVLTGWTLVPPGDNPEHGGEFTFNPRLHEPGAQKVLGKVLRRRNGGAGTCRASRSRRASRDRHACGHQAGPPFHCRYASARAGGEAWQRPSSIPAAISRRSPRRWCRRPRPGPSRPPNSSARASGSSAWCGRPGSRKPTPRGSRMGKPCSANPCGVRRRPRAFRTTKRSWIDGMGRRLDVANNFAERVSGRVDPQDVIETVLGSTVSSEVKQAVAPRREPPAGARAAVHVGRIPEEVSMTFATICPAAARR